MKKNPLVAISLVVIFCLGSEWVSAQNLDEKAKAELPQKQELKEVTQMLDSGKDAENQQAELATTANREWDPWESFNEKNFELNRQIDRYALKPVANAYKTVLPEPVRKSIGNALDNIDVVRRLVK